MCFEVPVTVLLGARLTSALRGWAHLRYEVTEEASHGADGARWSHTPELGIFHAATDVHGNVVVPEDRIRAALEHAGDPARLRVELDLALGQAWDDELEPSATPAPARPCAGCTASADGPPGARRLTAPGRRTGPEHARRPRTDRRCGAVVACARQAAGDHQRHVVAAEAERVVDRGDLPVAAARAGRPARGRGRAPGRAA